jgi:ATP-binding protein involved in chromosome partitioning
MARAKSNQQIESKSSNWNGLMINETAVREALKRVKYPGFSRDIVAFGVVRAIEIQPGAVRLKLHLSSPKPGVAELLKQDCERVLRALPDIQTVSIEVDQPAAAGGESSPNPWAQQSPIPGIGSVLAVASGKGGVGKSTVSVNLACAFGRLGQRIGLLDCDIYGPSIPLMMGINQRPCLTEDQKIEPLRNHGVKLMSIGFLLDPDSPVIWRGPMINRAIQQFLHSVDWGDLDILLVDLPPGTGDAQLSLCQSVPLDGGVVVTTPQEASLGVVRKGIAMFNQVHVPVIGMIENMSYFTTSTGERVEIFGHGGGQVEALNQGLPFLGEIPIFTEIRQAGDSGTPLVVSQPQHSASLVFLEIGRQLGQRLNLSRA